MYCIYSNKQISENEASIEHVIPLSLGGINTFTIETSREKNNEYGTYIEGAFENDFFTLIHRIKNGTKGHSGKKPTMKLKGKSDNHPISIMVNENWFFKIRG